jgi:hypothetical protein
MIDNVHNSGTNKGKRLLITDENGSEPDETFTKRPRRSSSKEANTSPDNSGLDRAKVSYSEVNFTSTSLKCKRVEKRTFR